MNRKIGIASLIWGASILLSRVIGIVREAVIGRMLGGGQQADVYWTAFVLPDFLNYLLAGGALSLVFIPIFGGYLARGETEAGWQAFSAIANFVAVAVTGFVVLLWFAAPTLAAWIAPGFDAPARAELVHLTRIMLPAQIFHLIGGLLAATLMARDRHVLPALAPLLYTGSIVGLGVALGPSLGAEGFAWGVLVGSILGPFGLPLVDCLRHGLHWRPVLSLRHPDFRRYFLLSLPIMLGFSVVVVDDWLLKRFGTLVGPGTVSQLQYAKTLMKVPMGVFGLATGVAAFPTLARLVGEDKPTEAFDTLVRAARAMLVLAFTAQAALTVAGTEVATVIYGTRRFSAAELDNIGIFTALMCLGLGAWAAQTLVARGFYAMQNTWTPTLLGTAVLVAAYPIYAALADVLGGAGLAAASSLAITVYVVLLTGMLRRKMAPESEERLAGMVLRMAFAVAIAVAAGLGVEAVLPPLPALVRGALSGGAAAVICLGLAGAFGVGEVSVVLGKVRRRVLRR